MNELEFLKQKLADREAGIPSHEHTSTDGERWLCSSPYCPRGGNVQDTPRAGPGESAETAEEYRRGTHA